jgi:proline iminopeptidase
MNWVSARRPQGRYPYCPSGSHFAVYHDERTWFVSLLGFFKALERAK